MKRKGILIWTAMLGIAVGAGGTSLFLFPQQTADLTEEASAKKEAVTRAAEGRGTLAYREGEAITLPTGVGIETITVQEGETVPKGQVMAVLDRLSIEEAMDGLQEEIAALDRQIGQRARTETEEIKADLSGRIKNLYVREGDSVQEVMLSQGALAEISADGKMALQIRTEEPLALGEKVEVRGTKEESWKGTVEEKKGKVYEITIKDTQGESGENAAVWKEEGELLGSGVLSVHQPVSVVGHSGRIKEIYVKNGETVRQGERLFLLEREEKDWESLEPKRWEREEQLQELLRLAKDGTLTAPCELTVSRISFREEEEEEEGTPGRWTVFRTRMPGQMQAVIEIPEQDILSVRQGQSVQVELEAAPSANLEGTVDQIGSKTEEDGENGGYPVTVLVEAKEEELEGLLEGMRVQARIQIKE